MLALGLKATPAGAIGILGGDRPLEQEDGAPVMESCTPRQDGEGENGGREPSLPLPFCLSPYASACTKGNIIRKPSDGHSSTF